MQQLVNAIARVLAVVAGIVLVVLIVINGVYAVARNALGVNVVGVFETSEVLLPIVALLALAETQRRGDHVSVELLVVRLPDRVASLVEAVGLLTVSIFLSWSTYVSFGGAFESYRSGEYRMGLAEVPVWPARLAIALGLGSLVLQLLVKTWILFRRGFGQGPSQEPRRLSPSGL